jgi:AraC family transcriptional regulator
MRHQGASVFTSRWTIQEDECVSAESVDIEIVRFDGVFQGPQEFPCQSVPYTVVALHDNLIEDHVLIVEGKECRTGPIRPGSVQIVPAGVSANGRCKAGEYQFSHLHLSSASLAKAADSLEMTRWELVDPQYEKTDNLLIQMADQLRKALGNPHRIDLLYAEEMSHAVAAHLLRFYGQASLIPSHAGSLPPWKLKRVFDYIEDTLPAHVSLEKMSGVAALSTSHFRASFRRSTGVSPSEYVQRRRIARAQQDLVETKLPISEIALRCGFADTSHFTRRFKAVSGDTPAAFRNRKSA